MWKSIRKLCVQFEIRKALLFHTFFKIYYEITFFCVADKIENNNFFLT